MLIPPLVALALTSFFGIGAISLAPKSSENGKAVWRPWGVVALLIFWALGVSQGVLKGIPDVPLILGLIVSVLATRLPAKYRTFLGAVGMLSAVPLMASSASSVVFTAFWAICAAAIVTLGVEACRRDLNAWAYLGGATSIALLNALSRSNHDGSATPLALYVTGGAFLALLLAAVMPEKPGIATAMLAGGGIGYYALNTVEQRQPLALLLIAGIVLGLVCNWMAPTGEGRAVRWGVMAAIWVTAATTAFSLGLGLGMAALMVGAVFVAFLTQQGQIVWGLAPLTALTVSRLVKEGQLSAIKSFDIGQHYALLGLVVGLVIVLSAADWIGALEDTEGVRGQGGAGVTILLAWGLIAFGAVFLGPKGYLGLMIGAAFSPLVAGMARLHSRVVLGLSYGAVGLLGLGFPTIARYFDIGREQKQQAFIVALFVVIILALIANGLAGKRKSVTA